MNIEQYKERVLRWIVERSAQATGQVKPFTAEEADEIAEAMLRASDDCLLPTVDAAVFGVMQRDAWYKAANDPEIPKGLL